MSQVIPLPGNEVLVIWYCFETGDPLAGSRHLVPTISDFDIRIYKLPETISGAPFRGLPHTTTYTGGRWFEDMVE